MFSILAYTIASGFLVRASGWGPESAAQAASWPKWKLWLSEFLSDYTCAAIFGVLSALYFTPLVGAACLLAFLLYRIPAFHGWQNWREMFWRGLWPSAIGFTLIGLAAHGTPDFGFAAIPFAGFYMMAYSGGYKWLPETVLGFNRHVWIEHASKWLFAIFILGAA